MSEIYDTHYSEALKEYNKLSDDELLKEQVRLRPFYKEAGAMHWLVAKLDAILFIQKKRAGLKT